MGSIFCPVCEHKGYLIKDGQYYKIAHNIWKIKQKKWTVSKCHLGNGKKTLETLEMVSKNRPDVIPTELMREIKNRLQPEFKNKQISQDPQLQELINSVFQLSMNLGKGWRELYSNRVYKWTKAKCPHCDQGVTAFFMKRHNRYLLKLDKLVTKT